MRLAELGPPQRTMSTGARGKPLAITPRLMLQGSCGIDRAVGDAPRLSAMLTRGDLNRLRQTLEADLQALQALYLYGRLHGAVRIRRRQLEGLIPVPWVHPDEPRLFDLARSAHALEVPLEVVVGHARPAADPWQGAIQVRVVASSPGGWPYWLIDESRRALDTADVQLARLVLPRH